MSRRIPSAQLGARDCGFPCMLHFNSRSRTRIDSNLHPAVTGGANAQEQRAVLCGRSHRDPCCVDLGVAHLSRSLPEISPIGNAMRRCTSFDLVGTVIQRFDQPAILGVIPRCSKSSPHAIHLHASSVWIPGRGSCFGPKPFRRQHRAQ
jgi:hypothetical protein